MQSLIARRTLLKMSLAAMALPVSLRRAPAAGGAVAVVELFTSQGCSRCPPADALLAELAEREDIVALAYHVDYWNYVGWKDELATPENTERQKAYAKAFEAAVYTPQMVVNGRYNVVGSDRAALFAALQQARHARALPVPVGLSYTDQSIVVDIGKGGTEAADAHVLVVYYHPGQLAKIGGGENKGKEIDYRNIVTGYQTVGMWHGAPLRLELPKSDIEGKGGRCAALVQAMDGRGRPGRILGAARMADHVY
ncbi:DUF1223 domain-containing protein [Chelativorans sp.]|uniref:DUF1223 domain-containing protein n=1 Tax=Chelativorans sp. TaxID=2203393 RepID=UPI00281178C0|nr:DUF1223 domain-containing protein [Chelativorans sp.]